MADIISKEKAIKLRREGLSIGEISKILNKNKSTISYWCRDISLTSKQISRLENKMKDCGLRSVLINAERSRALRKEDEMKQIALGEKDINKFSQRDLFICGLALYWGEGYKKGNNEFGFTNSDPSAIKLTIKWLEEIYNVKKDRLILRISINKIHFSREREVKKYWLKITNTKENQFTKTSFIQSNNSKIYSNNKTYYGTLRIKVRNGASLEEEFWVL